MSLLRVPIGDLAAASRPMDDFRIEREYGLTFSPQRDATYSERLRISAPDRPPDTTLVSPIDSLVQIKPSTSAAQTQLEFLPWPTAIRNVQRQIVGFQMPKSITLVGVDDSSVEQAAIDLLIKFNPTDKVSQIVNKAREFAKGQRPLFAPVGTPMGTAVQDPNDPSRRVVDIITMHDANHFINPSELLHGAASLHPASDSQRHGLIDAFRSILCPRLLPGGGTIRYVQQGNLNPNSPFTTVADAATSIQDAIDVSTAGDIVLVADNATYDEVVTLKGGVSLASIESLIGSPTANLPSIIPFAIGDASEGLVRATSAETFYLEGFVLEGDVPFTGMAVPISITQSSNGEIRRLFIRNFSKTAGHCLFIADSRNIRVVGCGITNNGNEDPQDPHSGTGVHVSNCDRVMVTNCDITANYTDSTGGGILSEDSQYLNVHNCTISVNVARVFGGGIGVLRNKSVTVNRCTVESNKVRATAPGGLVAVAIGTVFRDGNGGGGGIGFLDAFGKIENTNVKKNEAGRGGGIEFFAQAGAKVIDCSIQENEARDVDGGGIAVNHVDRSKEESRRNPATLVEDCNISNNMAGDDGGGFYATARVTARLKNCTVHNNSAGSNGGGVRATFGSTLHLENCSIHNNLANTEDENEMVGGGVAARNANVTIQDSSVKDNSIAGLAGGGIAFITAGYTNEISLFWLGSEINLTQQETIENGFEFSRAAYTIENCTVKNNIAQSRATPQGVRGGAAGGFYLGIGNFPVDLKISSTQIHNNSANHMDPVKRRDVLVMKGGTVVNTSMWNLSNVNVTETLDP